MYLDKLIQKCIAAVILAMLLLSAACDKDRHKHPELSTGEELYNYHCAACHKENGMGMFLKGIPANVKTSKNHREVILHIKKGTQSNQYKMPVYTDMPDAEAYIIANHVLELKRDYVNKKNNNDKVLTK